MTSSEKKKIRIVFMGSPEFALPSLKGLVEEPAFEVAAVYSMPDRPKGRGQKPAMTPIKKFAVDLGIPVRTPPSFRKDPIEVEALRAFSPDFLVVVGYGLILIDSVLKIPRLAPVNLHASLLPKYRGPSPIHFSLMHNEKETGNTVMFMNEKLDEGDILAQETMQASPDDTLESLHDRLSSAGASLLSQTLKDFAAGRVHRVVQDHLLATYTTKISAEIARIDWKKPAGEIRGLVRAMSPFPGAWFELFGERMKVGAALEGDPSQEESGKILEAAPEHGIRVACGNATSIRLLLLQRPGKAMMGVSEFLRGYKSALQNQTLK